jgi:hypothetical protein
VLFALLVYVTLDLSMPAMPGAFVFDPAESVESARTTTRGRAAMDVVQGPVPMPTFLMPATPHLETVDGARPVRGVGGPTPEVVIHLPRATLSSAPGSEDPQ